MPYNNDDDEREDFAAASNCGRRWHKFLFDPCGESFHTTCVYWNNENGRKDVRNYKLENYANNFSLNQQTINKILMCCWLLRHKKSIYTFMLPHIANYKISLKWKSSLVRYGGFRCINTSSSWVACILIFNDIGKFLHFFLLDHQI